MELVMGIHHDYKSKRGERAMAKQQKRESKFSDNSQKKEEEKLIKELKKAGLNNDEIKQFLEGREK
jgi:DNA-binding transcriptional regulator YhcF (GntR family)|tara:strand:- start:985 stop:1182 length:198 start_codon:yes stop_codon:yes gene_type:complete